MRTIAIVGAVLLVGLLAQADEPKAKKGGPGATKEAQKLPEELTKERSFRLTMPNALRMTPGQRRDIYIDLDNGIDFHQAVQLYFAVPDGVRVVPAHAQIMRGDKQTSVTVIADREAPRKGAKIKVIAEPETGAAIVYTIPIVVEK